MYYCTYGKVELLSVHSCEAQIQAKMDALGNR